MRWKTKTKEEEEEEDAGKEKEKEEQEEISVGPFDTKAIEQSKCNGLVSQPFQVFASAISLQAVTVVAN